MKIIVVEDEARVRTGIIRLIKRERPQYVVVGESDNGVDGMYMIKQLKPDLVITDIRMPRMSGLKMLENLEASRLTPTVVILSAYSDFEYAKTAIRYGVFEYLLKPVTAEELTQVLDRYALNRQGSANPGTDIPPAGYSPLVSAAADWIRTHYMQKITLEELADRFGITASYLSTLFSRETGHTFSSFLRDYRVERAKEMLCSGSRLIYEIAYRTGFDDVQYFCRVFKSVTGCSAKQYFRLHHGNPAQDESRPD